MYRVLSDSFRGMQHVASKTKTGRPSKSKVKRRRVRGESVLKARFLETDPPVFARNRDG